MLTNCGFVSNNWQYLTQVYYFYYKHMRKCSEIYCLATRAQTFVWHSGSVIVSKISTDVYRWIHLLHVQKRVPYHPLFWCCLGMGSRWISMHENIEAETKWPIFSRRHFPMHAKRHDLFQWWLVYWRKSYNKNVISWQKSHKNVSRD